MPIYPGGINPKIVLQKNTGWLVPSLITGNAATYSQTGTTVTVTSTGHNIPATIYNGRSVYLVIGSGLAVTGWFTNFQRVDANSFTCVSTVSQSTSGAVNTNLAETTITDLTVTLPGGSLGLNGVLRDSFKAVVFNSANNKTISKKYGGSSYCSFILTTTTATYPVVTLENKNSLSSQIGATISTDRSFSTLGTFSQLAINSAVDQSLITTVQCSTASEWICIESDLITSFV